MTQQSTTNERQANPPVELKAAPEPTEESKTQDMGKPEDVIFDVAQKVNADFVILGTKPHHSIRAALRGNTSEKVMDKLNIDVMALN